jgi:hypothetical protein
MKAELAEARTSLNQGTSCDQHCMGAMQAAANAGTEPESKNYWESYNYLVTNLTN